MLSTLNNKCFYHQQLLYAKPMEHRHRNLFTSRSPPKKRYCTL